MNLRKVLFVAEKNDVAKGVASHISGGQMHMRDGKSRYNKIYQPISNINILGTRSQLSVTSVSGHLMTWDFGPETRNWSAVPIGSLFDAPVYQTVNQNMKDVERTLKEEAARNDTLVIWTDCDREGENIGAEIVKVCTQVNPTLDVYRAKFSEVTHSAVINATNNLQRIDSRIVDAVDCRSELDLRIGAAFTRLQTLHLRQRFAATLGADDNQVVSYGSCQFPTLGFVVERYNEIERFVPESFWKLQLNHSRDGIKVEFNWDRVRLFDRAVVGVLYDQCREAQYATVQSVVKKPKSKYRPQALDTVELEKLAVRKLKMSAKEAMSIAEKLYNKGYISYPRTETNKFPTNINLSEYVNQQVASSIWGDFASEVEGRGPNPRNGNKSDEAHPPIHPLKYLDKNQLTNNNEWRLYELIVRHFLACVSWDAYGQETKVDLLMGPENEKFTATGLIIEDLGYMKVYVYDKWSDKTLPRYVEGERLSDCQLRIGDGTTQPPLLLNEADLIALMDKFGIGTDATHAEHIEKIKLRKYVGVKPDGRFLPGYLGLALVDGYDEMGYAMSKPQMRAELEKQLQEICQGRRTKQDVLNEQKEKYRTIFIQSEQKINLLSQALSRHINQNRNGGNQASGAANGGGRGGLLPSTTTRGGRGGRSNGRPQVAQIPDHEMNGDGNDRPTGRRGRGRGRGRGGGGGGGATRATNNANTTTTTNGSDLEGKICTCGLTAVQRTVQKDNPNKGKKFWTCSKPYGSADKCNYFEWA